MTCNDKLFQDVVKSKILGKQEHANFHIFVMKLMLLAKRGRPDMLT